MKTVVSLDGSALCVSAIIAGALADGTGVALLYVNGVKKEAGPPNFIHIGVWSFSERVCFFDHTKWREAL